MTIRIIGVHDPDKVFTGEVGINMMSDYFAWNKELSVIDTELQNATQEKRSFLVTIEPWPEPIGFKYDSNNDLLKAIIEGNYDQTTENICTILSKSKVPIYIRWGHEMELNNSRYPWTHATPELYINAYKKFVDKCRTKSKMFKFIWSPAGEDGLAAYWPGDNYVDLIGLSVYSYDQYEQSYLGHRRSFNEVFQPIYDRVKGFNKPLLIAEIGVTGTDAYKLEWLKNMKNEISNYNGLIGFVYLNTMDPQAAWDNNLGNPDWRLTKNANKILL